MRIFLTGATGFIGDHILRALVERGHSVTCLARGPGGLRIDGRAFPGVQVVEGEFTRPDTWLRALADHDVVVNAVGIIREQPPDSTFERVHEKAPVALFEAAKAAGVKKIVQISAMGADDGAASRYHLSKRAADRKLAEIGVPYVILRPSFVYGVGDHSMSFFASLAALPVTPIPGDGAYLVQPIAVEDLVRAVVMAIERPDLRDVAFDVGGGRTLSFEAMFDVLARWLGKARARRFHVPWRVMELVAATTDILGGRGPITGEELGMLRRGSHGDNKPFVERFGFEPVPFEVGLARRPRTASALQFARIQVLALPLRLSVAFIWVATGIVSLFVYPPEGSLALLARTGISGPEAPHVVFWTSIFEILLGLATAAGFGVRLLGIVQLLLIIGFTAILTVAMPELWAHPFGPLTKNVPLLGATLLMIGLAE
jgi:uncharacterized protein YbjT (DUF2867 family)